MDQNKNFSLYSEYYDLLYKDKDYEKEAGYVIQHIRNLQPAAVKILELGCGTGNHAKHFCNEGFMVTGVERSMDMVALAKKKAIQNFEPVAADISQYKLPDQYNVAVSLFHVISYLTGNEILIRCFQNTCEHLLPGGIFIFDIWYSPAVYFQKPETRIKKLASDSLLITRLAEPVIHFNEDVIDVNYEIIAVDKKTNVSHTFIEKHPMRHFSLPEISLLAIQTGFRLIRAEEFLTGKEPGQNTWGVCCIMQKN
jgi:SAM-dependent methyltransferase